MKSSEMQKLLQSGQPVVVGRLLRVTPETIKYVDRKTGARAQFDLVVLAVDTGAHLLRCGVDSETAKLPGFPTKGDVVIVLSRWTETRGQVEARASAVYQMEA